jgi:hypothetical protein
MQNAIINQLSEILNQDDTTEIVFIAENGNEVSIEDAIKQKIKGTIVERKFSKKEELSKLLFNKERTGIEDFLTAVSTFEKTIQTLWENSGYGFKSKNYEHLKDILSKYQIKEMTKKGKEQ